MKKTNLRLFLFGFIAAMLLLTPVFLRAEEDEEEKPMKPVPKVYANKHMPQGWWTDAKIIAEGKKIFETAQNDIEFRGKKEHIKEGCSQCHAIDSAKDRPKARGARDFRVAKKMNEFSDSYWFWRVSEGVPKTKMPAWKEKLTEEERWKAIAYEHTWSHGNKAEAHEHKEIKVLVEP